MSPAKKAGQSILLTTKCTKNTKRDSVFQPQLRELRVLRGEEGLYYNSGPQLEYRIKAVNVGGESIPSNTVAVVL